MTNCTFTNEFQTKLMNLLEEISHLQYGSNTFKEKNHEASVEAIICKHGFRENKVSTSSNKQSNVGYWYTKQPNGSQQPPDFRLGLEDNTMDIECKSCKTGYKPMWNASFPEQNTVYVFTNKKNNETIRLHHL